MGLINLFGRKEKTIDDVVIGIQSGITTVLILLLIFLVGYNAFGEIENAKNLNATYLPIISGWIGIILGFYFSREIADILSKKLKDEKNARKKDNERIEQELIAFKKETSEIIMELLLSKNNGKTKRQKK